MKKYAALTAAIIFIAVTIALPTSAQKSRHQTAEEAPVIAKRSLFGDTESRVAELGWLRPDCTTSTPDIRVVKAPSHGELRFEEGKAMVSGDQSALQKQCHGKPVEALRIYYKAGADYAGTDTFTVDVDTKLGFVRRYVFNMDIR